MRLLNNEENLFQILVPLHVDAHASTKDMDTFCYEWEKEVNACAL